MPRYVFVVYGNPVEGRDQEYLDGYVNRHLDDLRACASVFYARHLTIAEQQFTNE